ncbi:copper resistance protein NlpE N-terminal domain-containing protein [Flavobacterium pectinovorum]|uniref:Copper homeostasis protein n=1 Tax=Flavobacterium pectinovorum TaxID=29533 RepID=A0AB36NUK7_9FLAO|nr:copper resistance protein NlpE N-terminal domain-containing protein [Flavobacterium pectinovorum]OXA99211.1 copper homeostasis protein [Flavobacterium pectinovorum]SHN21632.1 copper homeostasis protein (lipoprotein) [Flavobacterium pectinovorum]
MKKLLLVLVVTAQFFACNSKKSEKVVETEDVEMNSNVSDQATIYKGVIPCADCEGIETVLKIYEGDGTIESHKFELSSTYQGKVPKKEFTEKGNFNLERGLEDDADGTIYVLNWDKPQAQQIYYGSYSNNREKIYLLDNRKIIKSDLNYSLTIIH